MKKINYKFERFLYNELNAYKTIPDTGNRTVEFSQSFKIADECFEKLDIKTIKNMLVNELCLLKINHQNSIDKAIKLIKDFK